MLTPVYESALTIARAFKSVIEADQGESGLEESGLKEGGVKKAEFTNSK